MFEQALKKNQKLVFGLIHLHAMPGTPYYTEGDLEKSIDKAILDAKALQNGGASGCLIQTVDRIYPAGDDTDYDRVSCMAVIANEVKRVVSPDFKLGVQIMWNCITPTLAVAKAVEADFIRCTALVGQTASPFGAIEANPLKVLEYRRKISAESVRMITEISGYHMNYFDDTYDKKGLLGLAQAAVMVGADAVEIMHTNLAINNQMAQDVRNAFPRLPIVLGGATDADSVKSRMTKAQAVFVGRHFKDENWGGAVSEQQVAAYMNALNS